MIRNYLTLALRRLKRQIGYSVINVAGLAVGMVACLLIALYIQDELSFDRFHEQADRLYSVSSYGNFWGENLNTPYQLATFMTDALPSVEQAARTHGGQAMPVLREQTNQRSDRSVLFSEADLFEMLSFSTLAGDPIDALASPDGAVITERTAEIFFGSESPIGQSLEFRRFGERYEITIRAVVEDVPHNSTIQFDVVVPLNMLSSLDMMRDSWRSFAFQVFILTGRPLDGDVIGANLERALVRHFEQTGADREPPAFHVQPMSHIYLSGLLPGAGGFKGQTRYLYIFGSIAIFLLLIAAVNYVNLVTAQSTLRAREVGVRKTMGAAHGQLVRQFLGESVLLSFAALVVAVILMTLALPAFNLLFDKQLSLDVSGAGWAIVATCCFVLLTAVAAGAYPAFALSSYPPTDVLRGSGKQSGQSRGSGLRKGLVVLQFTISAVLIAGTVIIYRQLDFVQTTDLGFDGEQVVVAEVPEMVPKEALSDLRERAQAHIDVVHASVANGLPSQFQITMGQSVDAIAPTARTQEESVQFKPAVVDYDFVETLGISVTAGRGFSEDFSADMTRGYLLSETAARVLGWTPEEAVGQPFRFTGHESVPEGEIVGVVNDFHIASLHNEIDPVVLQLSEVPNWSASYTLIAKVAPGGVRPALDHLSAQFEAVAPGEPFEYEFLDARFDAMYRTEQQLSRIFTTFAAVAILIACMGLFGLAAFTAQRRTKEIGIRKVLGASVANIVALLSKDFLVLVAVAFLIAIPLTVVVMNRWLEDFAYRIDIGPGIFVLVGCAAVAVAIAAVSYHSIKAATADPAKSLRYE